MVGRAAALWPGADGIRERQFNNSNGSTQPRSTGPFLPMSSIPQLFAVIGSPCPCCGQTMQLPDRPPSRDQLLFWRVCHDGLQYSGEVGLDWEISMTASLLSRAA
jgi:hypothetical protein